MHICQIKEQMEQKCKQEEQLLQWDALVTVFVHKINKP